MTVASTPQIPTIATAAVGKSEGTFDTLAATTSSSDSPTAAISAARPPPSRLASAVRDMLLGVPVRLKVKKLVEVRFDFGIDGGPIEYGLIAALVSIAAIVAMGAMGNELGEMFNTVASELDNAQN